jgi:hypothetical protein
MLLGSLGLTIGAFIPSTRMAFLYLMLGFGGLMCFWLAFSLTKKEAITHPTVEAPIRIGAFTLISFVFSLVSSLPLEQSQTQSLYLLVVFDNYIALLSS